MLRYTGVYNISSEVSYNFLKQFRETVLVDFSATERLEVMKASIIFSDKMSSHMSPKT